MIKNYFLLLMLLTGLSACSQSGNDGVQEVESTAKITQGTVDSNRLPEIAELSDRACKLIEKHILNGAGSQSQMMALAEVFGEETMATRQIMFDSLNKQHPSASERQVLTEMVIMVYHDMVDYCPRITEMIEQAYGPCPPENKMLTMLKDSTDAMLSRSVGIPLINYRELNDEYADYISNLALSESNAGLMNESYGEDFMRFLDEQEVFMFHRSKPYYKMILGSIVHSQ